MVTNKKYGWPKGPTQWIVNRTLYISIPFTWDLPLIKRRICQRSFFWDRVVVGGPAVSLMSDHFRELHFVSVGPWSMPGALQRAHPLATKTTRGCIRSCKFCAVPKIEAPYFKTGFQELDDWPDLPILIDNNLLAASRKHFDRVIDRLKRHKTPIDSNGTTADFNQGLDARLLTKYHAGRIAEIRKPLVRLALDSQGYSKSWAIAFKKLRAAGLPKRAIRSYALIGFDSGPAEAWERCQWIESHGIKALPAWFHPLDAMEHNGVTEDQVKLGWSDLERKRIMQWYYQRNEQKYGKSEHKGGK